MRERERGELKSKRVGRTNLLLIAYLLCIQRKWTSDICCVNILQLSNSLEI